MISKLKLSSITKEDLQSLLNQQRLQNENLIIDMGFRNTFPIALDNNFCVIDILYDTLFLGHVGIPITTSKINIPYIKLPIPNKEDFMIRYISPFIKRVTFINNNQQIDIPIQIFSFNLTFNIENAETY